MNNVHLAPKNGTLADEKMRRSDAMICSVEGCEKAVCSKRMCSMHYQRFKHHGSTEKPVQKRVEPVPCKYEGCGKTAKMKGWCEGHYRRNRKFGSPELRHKPRNTLCAVDGCESLRWHGDLCGAHAARMKRKGTVEARVERKCSVAGCDKKHHGGGYCLTHRRRVRKHGTTECSQAPPGAGLTFLKANVHHTFGCLRWPFAADRKGYGRTTFKGKVSLAHRVMCILAHGEPPFAEAQAAHNCGNPWCVSPRHLRWATGADNQADKEFHDTLPFGERHWNAKVTSEQAIAIFHDERLWATIAEAHGVSVGIVGHIKQGNTWSHATGYYGLREAS